MTTTTAPEREASSPGTSRRLPSVPTEKLSDPKYQAYLILRTAFIAAPILMGLDKFFNWMTFWPKYLWVGFPNFLSVSPHHFMQGVGVIEIAAGLGVLLLPRAFSYVVVGWLGGIITNLVILSILGHGHTNVFWDIALRDFGLLLAALALARLAAAYTPQLFHSRRS
jgi:hypothetical protein